MVERGQICATEILAAFPFVAFLADASRNHSTALDSTNNLIVAQVDPEKAAAKAAMKAAKAPAMKDKKGEIDEAKAAIKAAKAAGMKDKKGDIDEAKAAIKKGKAGDDDDTRQSVGKAKCPPGQTQVAPRGRGPAGGCM